MDVEEGGMKLATLIIIGVLISIALGIEYTTQAQNEASMANSGASNAIIANYTKNANSVSSTAGTNGAYVYYILFMALILVVILSVFTMRRRNK
jgi:uncharacterized integral membrane protein